MEYEITFADGAKERVEAHGEAQAKNKAIADRTHDLERALERFKYKVAEGTAIREVRKLPVDDGKIHYVISGDSLFGFDEVACGWKPEYRGGERVTATQAAFFLEQVTCRKCMASQQYRDDCKEQGIEHPFTTAAKKAHETMKKNKQKEEGT